MKLLHILLVSGSLVGCAEVDPFRTGGVWQPAGVNALNMSTQVANKGDLIRGRGARGSDGTLAASAVARLWEGNPRPIPQASSKGSGGS